MTTISQKAKAIRILTLVIVVLAAVPRRGVRRVNAILAAMRLAWYVREQWPSIRHAISTIKNTALLMMLVPIFVVYYREFPLATWRRFDQLGEDMRAFAVRHGIPVSEVSIAITRSGISVGFKPRGRRMANDRLGQNIAACLDQIALDHNLGDTAAKGA